SGLNIERLVQLDAQQQAADQVSISNSVASLRVLSSNDWRDFVERMSHVERQLEGDPAGVYAAMDFASRDQYRHVIERLARHSQYSEERVAIQAIALASAQARPPPDTLVAGHVGYYLVGPGLAALEQAIDARVPPAQRWQRQVRRAPLLFFLGPVTVLALAMAWPLARNLSGLPSWQWLLTIPLLLMTSRLAMSLINGLVMMTLAPSLLPRLDMRDGIPAAARTLVAVPTLVGQASDVEELVEGLEVRFLANRDEHLHFALLTDFMDAPTQTQPGDDALLTLAVQLIDDLNRRYPTLGPSRFFLLHRPRRWNAGEGVWMGHERKRGKLAELNALLRGGSREPFSPIVGDIDALGRVRYVITLDTDTQLPRDAARQFVGAMEHPLNHPVLTADGRVSAGYAVLQPRIGISLPSTARSGYAQLFGSDAGIDPYTRAVSDVYQDLFGNGSFIGKGIYAVDAFEQALAHRFADDCILSHDLIEGCYAHSGLLSDVQLFEDYPARFSTDVKRRHRWIRGDWQLLPWLLPWGHGKGTVERAGLSALARWKIFDNLRRSLEPAALLTLLLWGWLGVDGPVGWTLGVLALVFAQPLLDSLLALARKPFDVSLRHHLNDACYRAGKDFLRSGLTLAWLPFETHYSLDAITRTLWRMLVSKRHLLQWSASREVERSSINDLPGLYRLSWVSPALALAVAGLLVPRPWVLLLALPLLALWLVGPAMAWWGSRSPAPQAFDPSAEELGFLRTLARRTWAFFDAYVGPADHWLPPDNIQHPPYDNVAHRTSPTNMGMALLSHLAAHDFGYLSSTRLLQRLGLMLTTLEGLERYRGHFYNWYDTQTLQPLAPLYVSTVDSGNLAGLLLTLRPGILALGDSSMVDGRVVNGLLDTLGILQTSLVAAHLPTQVVDDLHGDTHALQHHPDLPPHMLLELLQRGIDLPVPSAASAAGGDAEFWTQALNAQCLDFQQEIQACQQAEHRVEHMKLSQDLATRIATLAIMEFDFLYDSARDLFAIGYNVSDRRLDTAFYDLLASEVRLTHFVTIAQGQVPQASWFNLGRLLTSSGGVPVLLSWSGSMFEYLMPMLLMPSYAGTLLDQTCHAAVARQIEYGNQLGIPWGVSESAYNAQDASFNYQYRAFGVPGLGLKRGLGDDSVVAPYASVLALMVAPDAATRNLQRLDELGASGRFGLYEALDYTQARLPPGQRLAVVRSFMAHHQGMSLLALTSLLLDRPMQRRFEAEPPFQACALLLQERVPKTSVQYVQANHAATGESVGRHPEAILRVFDDPQQRRPAVQLLSNGRYHV
ncbi:glucoamylase family protein, partial [Pseudomonas sp.]|uniref:glucoamylase family protein n=1 Tax=Pseudomonas sp. TaxID=306 RepID=UPI003CC60F63